MATLMNNLLQQSGDEQRLHDLAQHDAADAQFDRALHRVTQRECCDHLCDEGRDCPASEALPSAWAWISNTVQDMDVGDWLAVLAVVCAIAAYWSH